MARCSNCSAPLPRSGIICEYCGTRNDIDLQGEYKFVNMRPNQVRNCPFCKIRMQTIDIGQKITFFIERCPDCYGIFLDVGELDALVEQNVKGVTNVDFVKLQQITENPRHIDILTYRKCPVCETVMNRKNYGGGSGVIMDVCTEHGIWLDSGELRHIFEWVKVGGHKKEARSTQKKAPRRHHKNPPPKEVIDAETTRDFFNVLGELLSWR